MIKAALNHMRLFYTKRYDLLQRQYYHLDSRLRNLEARLGLPRETNASVEEKKKHQTIKRY